VFTEDPAGFVGLIVILLLSLSWHEAAHAWVADRLGDPTARELGRVTLNPIRHLDPFLSVLLPMLLIMAGSPIVFGGGKPVPINVANFRHRARDFMLVALAGPGSNLLLALAFSLVWIVSVWFGWLPSMVVSDPYVAEGARVMLPTIFQPVSLAGALLRAGVELNLLLAMFNMVPLPPLDGSRIIGWLLPRPLQPRWYALDRIGLLLVIVVFFFLGGQTYLGKGINLVFDELGLVIDRLAALGPVA
jgi:Zn-dependent protease